MDPSVSLSWRNALNPKHARFMLKLFKRPFAFDAKHLPMNITLRWARKDYFNTPALAATEPLIHAGYI